MLLVAIDLDNISPENQETYEIAVQSVHNLLRQHDTTRIAANVYLVHRDFDPNSVRDQVVRQIQMVRTCPYDRVIVLRYTDNSQLAVWQYLQLEV